jgi:hypothetical protein
MVIKTNANSLLVNELAFVLIPIKSLLFGQNTEGVLFQKKMLNFVRSFGIN